MASRKFYRSKDEIKQHVLMMSDKDLAEIIRANITKDKLIDALATESLFMSKTENDKDSENIGGKEYFIHQPI